MKTDLDWVSCETLFRQWYMKVKQELHQCITDTEYISVTYHVSTVTAYPEFRDSSQAFSPTSHPKFLSIPKYRKAFTLAKLKEGF